MIDNRDPSQWTAPAWHPDWGNVGEELEHLRNLGIAIKQRFDEVVLRLQGTMLRLTLCPIPSSNSYFPFAKPRSFSQKAQSFVQGCNLASS